MAGKIIRPEGADTYDRCTDSAQWEELCTAKEPYQLEHCRTKNSDYLVIWNGLEKCTIWVTPWSWNYVIYSDDRKAEQYEIIKMEAVRPPRVNAFFELWNVQHAGAERKKNHGSQYHLYLIPEDVDLEDGVVFAYGGFIQRDVRNIRKAFLVRCIVCFRLMRRRLLKMLCAAIRLLWRWREIAEEVSAMDS